MYFCSALCGGAAGIGGGMGTGGIPKACGVKCIPPPAGGAPGCMPGIAPIPGIPGGIGGMRGASGILGICGAAHGDAAAGAGGGGGAAAGGMPCAPCKSRSADPEITRVNSPGPEATGGGALGAIDGGVAHGDAAGCGGGGAAAKGAGAGGAG
jgi:hypothetical protein